LPKTKIKKGEQRWQIRNKEYFQPENGSQQRVEVATWRQVSAQRETADLIWH
jgi:hypothetical protein